MENTHPQHLTALIPTLDGCVFLPWLAFHGLLQRHTVSLTLSLVQHIQLHHVDCALIVNSVFLVHWLQLILGCDCSYGSLLSCLLWAVINSVAHVNCVLQEWFAGFLCIGSTRHPTILSHGISCPVVQGDFRCRLILWAIFLSSWHHFDYSLHYLECLLSSLTHCWSDLRGGNHLQLIPACAIGHWYHHHWKTMGDEMSWKCEWSVRKNTERVAWHKLCMLEIGRGFEAPLHLGP